VRYELLKILLVDDNAHMRTLLTEILRAVGVRDLFEAADGSAGLKLLKRQEIDIVFTDLAMQPMDGIEFVKQVRTGPDSPGSMTPVIMVTGYSTAQRVGEARDAGVTEFLTKPLTAQAVLDRVTRVVEKPRTFVRSMTYFGPDRRRRQLPNYHGPWRRVSDPGRTEPSIEIS